VIPVRGAEIDRPGQNLGDFSRRNGSIAVGWIAHIAPWDPCRREINATRNLHHDAGFQKLCGHPEAE
jgi:hypothetical protein